MAEISQGKAEIAVDGRKLEADVYLLVNRSALRFHIDAEQVRYINIDQLWSDSLCSPQWVEAGGGSILLSPKGYADIFFRHRLGHSIEDEIEVACGLISKFAW